LLERAKIIPLNNAYGVTLQRGCLEALVVSRETEPTARKINEERAKLGLEPLNIIVIDMVPSENHAPYLYNANPKGRNRQRRTPNKTFSLIRQLA
jgi:phosphopantetheine adenylyltransferase